MHVQVGKFPGFCLRPLGPVIPSPSPFSSLTSSVVVLCPSDYRRVLLLREDARLCFRASEPVRPPAWPVPWYVDPR